MDYFLVGNVIVETITENYMQKCMKKFMALIKRTFERLGFYVAIGARYII